MLEKEAQKQQTYDPEETTENNEHDEKPDPDTNNTNVIPDHLKTSRFIYSTTSDSINPENTPSNTSSTSADYSPDAPTDDPQSKNSQYPVSSDGSCPYCYSKNVKYIIVFAEGMKDKELPRTLCELLKRGQAFKMAKGTSIIISCYNICVICII